MWSLVLSVSDFKSVVRCLLCVQEIRHNQTWYKIGVWVQSEEGEGLLLASREKTGHGDTSRQFWSRGSPWDVGCDYCDRIRLTVKIQQTVSVSLGTHRERSSNSNTKFISIIWSVNSGAVFWIVWKRGSNMVPMDRILRTLSSIVHLSLRSHKIVARVTNTQHFRRVLETVPPETKVMSVIGHIDEIHILITVRTAPIVGYLSPSLGFFGQLCLLERSPHHW